MEIEYINSNTKKFCEVAVGETFTIGFTGNFYMKVFAVDTCNNAVNIKSGKLLSFNNDVEVIPIKARVVIDEPVKKSKTKDDDTVNKCSEEKVKSDKFGFDYLQDALDYMEIFRENFGL